MTASSDGPAPGVSVVLAAFNAEALIEQTIRSVLDQTYANFELIVIDDGSTDATAAVARSFSDPRVRLIQTPNGGPAMARNLGFENSRAEWIAVVDSDDYWAPNRLAILLDVAARQPADMIADDLVIVLGDDPAGTFFEEVGLHLSEPVRLDPLDFVEGRLAGKPTPRPGIIKPLMRRAFLAHTGMRYVEDVRGPEDWLFYCQCALRGARLMLIPDRTYFYRRVPDSLSLRDPIAMLEAEALAITYLSQDPLLPDQLQPLMRLWLKGNQHRLAFHRLRLAVRSGRFLDALRTVRDVPEAAVLYARHLAMRARVRAGLGTRITRLRDRTRAEQRLTR